MNEKEKAYFMYGYIYNQAQELKNTLECYKDWKISDIIKELIENIKN